MPNVARLGYGIGTVFSAANILAAMMGLAMGVAMV
jgi:hypothetical protein